MGSTLMQQVPWMLRWGDLCPSPYSLTTPLQGPWMTKGKCDSHPVIFGRCGKAYSEHWPISCFSLFLLTIYFQWKGLEGLLCPGQSSPVCAVQSGLFPSVQLFWSCRMSQLRGQEAICTLQCRYREKEGCWPHIQGWSFSFMESMLKHPWWPHRGPSLTSVLSFYFCFLYSSPENLFRLFLALNLPRSYFL